MRDPTNPNREMLSAEEAARVRAELDARWDDLEANGFYANGGDKKYQELILDEFFAPFEVTCPILANYYRKTA